MFLSREDSFLRHKAGLLDAHAFASYVAGVHLYLSCPGMRAMRKVTSAQFGRYFREFVDGKMAKTSVKAKPDLYAAWQEQVRIDLAAIES